MAVTNFIQTIWSKKILEATELECKLVGNCWREYEGDAKYAGSVKILGIEDVEVRPYTRNTDITIDTITDVSQELLINKANYFSVFLDDVDKAQSVPGLMEAVGQNAAHQLSVKRDEYVADLIKTGTNVTTATANTEEAVKTAIDTALVALKERNCNEEMVIELTPAAAMAFLNSLTIKSTDNPEYIKKGVIGYYHGCKVIESNGLAKDTGHAYCAIRAKKAIAFVAQLEKVDAVSVERRFGDIIKGLDVFGGKIIDNNRLQVVKIPV